MRMRMRRGHVVREREALWRWWRADAREGERRRLEEWERERGGPACAMGVGLGLLERGELEVLRLLLQRRESVRLGDGEHASRVLRVEPDVERAGLPCISFPTL